MDDQWNTETSEEARHPWQIFDIDAQDDSLVHLFKQRFWKTRLAQHLLQCSLYPHFGLPYSRDRGECALHRFERIKVDRRGKRFARHFNLLDTVQAKEALSLSQVTVTYGVPEPRVINNAVGIIHAFRHIRARRAILEEHT